MKQSAAFDWFQSWRGDNHVVICTKYNLFEYTLPQKEHCIYGLMYTMSHNWHINQCTCILQRSVSRRKISRQLANQLTIS